MWKPQKWDFFNSLGNISRNLEIMGEIRKSLTWATRSRHEVVLT